MTATSPGPRSAKPQAGIAALASAAILVAACGASPPSASEAPGTVSEAPGTATNSVSPSIAPTATPFAASQLVALSQSTIGPTGRVISVAPNGQLVAVEGTERGSVCVARVDAIDQTTCSDAALESLDERGVAWAPDSSRVAFHENVFQFIDESDLWVMDVATGNATNLTDDGEVRPLTDLPDDSTAIFDLVPAWAPDGSEIAFSRIHPDTQRNTLVRIPAGGGEVVEVAEIAPDQILMYYGTAWAEEGGRVVYTVRATDASDPRNGVHVIGADGEGQRQVIGPDTDNGPPVLVGVAPSGRLALVTYEAALLRNQPAPFALADLESGETTVIAASSADSPITGRAFVRAAALSPDGSKLAYVFSTAGTTEWTLVVVDLPAGEPQELVTADGDSEAFAAIVRLWWPRDDLIAASVAVGQRLTTIEVGRR